MKQVAAAFGVPLLAWLLTSAALVGSFAIVLACVNAGARTLFLLAQHGVLPRAFRGIHPVNRTPGFSVTVSSLIALSVVIPLSVAGIPPRDIWG